MSILQDTGGYWVPWRYIKFHGGDTFSTMKGIYYIGDIMGILSTLEDFKNLPGISRFMLGIPFLQ